MVATLCLQVVSLIVTASITSKHNSTTVSNGNHNGSGHNSTVESTTFLFDRRVMLQRDELVPDVLPKIPEEELFVSFHSAWVNFGNLVSCSASANKPTVLDWKTEKNAYYTIILTGPDCPSRKNHTDREFLHWMVTNVRGLEFMEGDTMAEYIGAAPSYVKGAHRFLFIVFKQPEPQKMSFNEPPIFDAFPFNEKRRKFSTQNFAKKYGLEAIAANYYWIDLDKPVPTFEPWFRTDPILD